MIMCIIINNTSNYYTYSLYTYIYIYITGKVETFGHIWKDARSEDLVMLSVKRDAMHVICHEFRLHPGIEDA